MSTALVAHYLAAINQKFISGHATEHTYRGDLGVLLEQLLPNLA